MAGFLRRRTQYFVKRKMEAPKIPESIGAMIQARKTCEI
jgi:hypothetical protein